MFYGELNVDKYIREEFFPDVSYIGTMVEVGAGPPEVYSMSKHFRDSGWRCICIEPNPKFVAQHKELNNEIYQYACADFIGETTFTIVTTKLEDNIDGVSFSSIIPRYSAADNHTLEEIPVSVVTLDSLLKKLKVKEIDLVTVDTEGWELDVMRGFSVQKYSPKVIVLENLEYRKEYEKYMERNEYTLYKKVDYNYIFTKK